ncbi:hypothetical protein JW960_16055 [candidate division KSB1 bacterium]|nr:hypothetical protein [candidate division KSB1 bacterium]
MSKAGRNSRHNFVEYQETVAFDTVRVPMHRNGTPLRDDKLRLRDKPLAECSEGASAFGMIRRGGPTKPSNIETTQLYFLLHSASHH